MENSPSHEKTTENHRPYLSFMKDITGQLFLCATLIATGVALTWISHTHLAWPIGDGLGNGLTVMGLAATLFYTLKAWARLFAITGKRAIK